MTVKEILSQAAFLLGKEELADYFSGDITDQNLQREAEALLRCYNLVENEIALDYLPLTAEETLPNTSGEIAYTSFLRAPVSVLSVTDVYGNRLPYTIFPEYIRTKQGTAVVTYTYAPESKTIADDCEYNARVSKYLLAFGVACEYCLINGLYEEAVLWDKKFKDALLCSCSVNSPHIVRSRRWV